eukprot:5040179-Alexandrium_andersonii.AAC.1
MPATRGGRRPPTPAAPRILGVPVVLLEAEVRAPGLLAALVAATAARRTPILRRGGPEYRSPGAAPLSRAAR